MHVEVENIFMTSHCTVNTCRHELQIVKDLLMWSYGVTNQEFLNIPKNLARLRNYLLLN